MYFHSQSALLNACRTLFGNEVNLSQDFLDYLQPDGAKSAFRNQAKAHHPDLHTGSAPHIRKQQTERFREIRQAYDLLIEFLEKRHSNHPTATARSSTHRSSYKSEAATRRHKQQTPHARPSAIPAIPLEFGMYAFYQGKVTYQQLIEALVWQRKQRPTVGAIARKWGWLSEAKVAQVLGHRGHAVRFGKKAIELGYLKSHQVEALLQYQRSQQTRIGGYFVKHGLLSEKEAEDIAQRLKLHNSQIRKRAGNKANTRR